MNCPNCGAPLPDGARFCTGCGTKLSPADAAAQFCPACGAARRANAKFCTGCGRSFADPPGRAESAPEVSRDPSAGAAPETNGAVPDAGAADPSDWTAPDRGGEFVCGARSLTEEAPEGRAPYLNRLLQTLKQPRTLIPLAALLASWIGLSFARDSENVAVKLLSWLSFGRGGLDRGFPGDLGGMLGKTAVGAALLGLCSGGSRSVGTGALSFARRLKAVFTGKAGAAGVAGTALGLLLGAGGYLLFAGVKTADWESSMAGIAGAVLSLSALGKRFAAPVLHRGAAVTGLGRGNGAADEGGGFLPALLAGAAAGFPLCALVLTIV